MSELGPRYTFFSWLNELHSNALKNHILKSRGRLQKRSRMSLQCYVHTLFNTETFFPHTCICVGMIVANLSLKKLAHSITEKRFRNLRHFAVLIKWSTGNKRIARRQNENNICTYLIIIIISRLGFHWKCFKQCMITVVNFFNFHI